MVRMVVARHLVMTGLAFTVGLLIGLCLHLPGVSSPLQAPTWRQGPLLQALGPRTQRRARAVPSQEDAHLPLEDARPGEGEGGQTLRRKIQSDAGGSQKRGAASENATLEGGHEMRIQQRVRAVQAAYARIRAVRGANGGRQDGLIEPARQVHKDPASPDQGVEEPPSPRRRQQNRLSLGKVFPKKEKKEKAHQGAGKAEPDPPGEKDDTPVYGSKTVSVMVTAGEGPAADGLLRPPPPPRPPQTETGQSAVSGDQAGTQPAHSQGGDAARAPGRRQQGDDVTRLRQDQFSVLEDLVTDGIYWSRQMELLVPPGFSDDEVRTWRRTVEALKVVRLEEGCGRMQNRRLTLEDASQACARYRVNTDQMQGEVYSYYLSRLLGIRNLPPVVLGAPSPAADPRWAAVDAGVTRAQWSPDKPVVLTPYMDQLRPVYIPRELRQPASRDSTGNLDVRTNLHPSSELLANRTLEQLRELVQWSDLIVFDFLTANVDRLVNNLFNLQWNSEMMASPTHNLEARPKDELLVFLDNESGLFHSYRLLDKYAHYHDDLLAALCVFRPETARALRRLHREKSASRELMDLYRQEEPLHWMLPPIPESNQKTLEERIAKVVDQINRCESRYSSRDLT